jgi:hypothetical protein
MNLKRILKYLILGIGFTLLFYLTFEIRSELVKKSEIARKTKRLPDFCFYTLYGTRFLKKNIKKGNSCVIVFFNPDCHHCAYEIESIVSNAGLFFNTDILLVSDQPALVLKQISQMHNLSNHPQIEILHTNYRHIRSYFGAVTAPSTFVYSKDHALLKVFRGEVSAEAIIRMLNGN